MGGVLVPRLFVVHILSLRKTHVSTHTILHPRNISLRLAVQLLLGRSSLLAELRDADWIQRTCFGCEHEKKESGASARKEKRLTDPQVNEARGDDLGEGIQDLDGRHLLVQRRRRERLDPFRIPSSHCRRLPSLDKVLLLPQRHLRRRRTRTALDHIGRSEDVDLRLDFLAVKREEERPRLGDDICITREDRLGGEKNDRA